jgi:hypothetical protein
MRALGRLRLRCSLGYWVVNLPGESIEKSPTPRAPKTAVFLMAVIVICLAMLAVFANVQRSRRDAVEAVAVRSTTSPTPRER